MVAYRNVLGDAYPGPYVQVTLTNGTEVQEFPGILDTGSDITTIPMPLTDTLKLQKISDGMDLHDATGDETTGLPVYVIDEISFEGFTVRRLTITATNYPVVVIGRDVLNDIIATFDGPALQFTLGQP